MQPQDVDAEPDSRAIITMAPNSDAFIQRQNDAFTKAFYRTLDGESAGSITSYLFYDLQRQARRRVYAEGYDPVAILSGGMAWERRAAEKAEGALHAAHSFGGGDTSVVRYALENGLASILPEKLKIVSYGGGDQNTFLAIDGQIFDALLDDPTKLITDFCAVDIHPRYVDQLTILVARHFDIHAEGVHGDFLRNGRLNIRPSKGTPLITIFGGSFENVSVEIDRPSAETNAAVAWGKINRQHGLGSIVIKTFDSDQNPVRQNEQYAATANFEAFELSAFARAAALGVIQNPQYDVLKHWRLASQYNPNSTRQEMRAECLVDHSLITPKGIYDFKAGDKRMIFTLSHKWDLATHQKNIERAGGELMQVYKEPGNPKVLLAVKFVREPDADIKQFIPY